MSQYHDAPELKNSVLGKTTTYEDQYNPSLLHPIARSLNRDGLGISAEALPFAGVDIWTGYELSWLNSKGKPQVALAEFTFSANSSHIIESKSFKLYLNSFNQTMFEHWHQVEQALVSDLSAAARTEVKVTLYRPDELAAFALAPLPGTLLDELDIAVEHYQPTPALLSCSSNAESVSETVHSHLLKSNCLITSQPDWASIVIEYQGPAICHEALLRYLISFRQHNEFHEQCVERIFCDIQRQCQPEKLSVYARYTRRGGLDINPFRSNVRNQPSFNGRINRQ